MVLRAIASLAVGIWGLLGFRVSVLRAHGSGFRAYGVQVCVGLLCRVSVFQIRGASGGLVFDECRVHG